MKLKGLIKILLAALIFTSCANTHTPIGVLSPSKMQEVLWDLLKADEFVLEHRPIEVAMNPDSTSEALYQKIFHMHNTDKAQFEKSLAFYQGRPDFTKVVLDSVMAMADREKNIYYRIDSVNNAKNDSINNIKVREMLWRTKRDSMLNAYADSFQVITNRIIKGYAETAQDLLHDSLTVVPVVPPADSLLPSGKTPTDTAIMKIDTNRLNNRVLKFKPRNNSDSLRKLDSLQRKSIR